MRALKYAEVGRYITDRELKIMFAAKLCVRVVRTCKYPLTMVNIECI